MKNMIYKQRTVVIVLMAFLLSFTGCIKDILDTSPDTSISDATAFATPERVAAQVTALYKGLKSANFYGGRYLIFNELRADEFLMGNPDPGQAMNVWAHTVNSGSSEVIGMWSSGFQAINRANTFIAGLQENPDVISPELFTQYIAEAKFVRAVSYLALVQVYARPYTMDNGASPGIPLRLQRENSGANNDLARSTVAEVYAQILQDLNEAEDGLPESHGDNYTDRVKAQKNTAIAFKVRTQLYKGDYTAAVAEASRIVSLATISSPSGVDLSLEPDYSDLFTGHYDGNEAVFYMPFTDADAGSLITYYFRAPPAAGSGYYLNAGGILANPVFTNAADKRSSFIVTSQGQRWLSKYNTPNPNTDYVPVMRYAEVLLNYAEAAARNNDLSAAATLLKAVRNRSDAGYTFNPADLASQSKLIELILTEKRIEFLGEGFRVPDVQRQVLPIPGKTAPSGSAPELAPSATLYVWPISSEELSTNSLMTPNP